MSSAQEIFDRLPQKHGETILGGILITGMLGQGGMGVVLRGLHLRLSIPVAVKFINVTPQADTRVIVNEAQLAARINHINVVRVYDVNRDGDLIYVVQELVDGPTVHEVIHSQPPGKHVSEQFVLEVARDVASGLDAIHKLGVVHRDIKPSNLMTSRQERVTKILDLGIAHQMNTPQTLAAPAAQRETQQACGTPGYISPEILWNLPVTFASDIYSLGVTLYELATGKVAFGGSTEQVLLDATERELPDARQGRPALTGATAELIARCTRINPDERFQTAAELLKSIEGALTNFPDAVRPGGAVQHNGTGPLVLCAEDEPDIADYLKAVLDSAGYRVEICPDGRQALDRIPVAKPAIVLLDIDMPKMTGIEVCRALRSDPACKDVPVIFLTAHNEQEAIRQAIWEGATDYLTKPFLPEDVLDRVHCLSRMTAMQKELSVLNNQYAAFKRRLKSLGGL